VLDDASTADGIAATFVAARTLGRALDAFPGAIPPSLADAYRVQDAAIGRMTDSIVGWKVGRVFPPASERFGVDRLAGPIFARSVVHDRGGEPPNGVVYAGGFGAAEAEFVLRLGRTPPAGKARYSLDDAAALVDRVHVGIEIASSPLPTINDLGPAVIVSDFGNNNGLVIGPEIPDWRHTDYASWTATTLVDGVEAGRGTAAAFPDGPLGSVRFLLDLAAARGITLAAGTWVSSGAISGVHSVQPGQVVEARFGTAAVVRCRIVAAPRG
jgi:2-keto-4-pentenoate hydratase